MDDEQMREFIEQIKWIFAKTYAEICPHEYIVKTKINFEYWDTFKAVVEYIRNVGFKALYNGRAGMYYILDEHYYWTMGEPIEFTTIINRAKSSEYDLVDGSWIFKK